MAKEIDTPENWRRLLDEEQLEFVEAYNVTKSVAASADMIGITPSRAATYFSSPTIKLSIYHRSQEAAAATHITPEGVLEDLALLRDQCMGRVPIPVTKWVDGLPVTKWVRDFNASAAHKAIQDLGRSIAMFTDKKEITIPATDSQIEDRLMAIFKDSGVIDAEYTEVDEIETAVSIPDQTDLEAASQVVDAALQQEDIRSNIRKAAETTELALKNDAVDEQEGDARKKLDSEIRRQDASNRVSKDALSEADKQVLSENLEIFEGESDEAWDDF